MTHPSGRAAVGRGAGGPGHETYQAYRSLLDNMLEGCQIIGSDWRYLYLNAAAEAHNRRPNDELLGQVYMDMWPGIEETVVFAAMQRCMEERLAARLENRFVYPDGTLGWFNLSLQPVPEGIFILSIDITERRQTDESLRASETRFRSLIENSSEQTSIFTRDGILLYENPSTRAILGYPYGSLLGQQVWDIVHPDDLPRLQAAFELLVEEPELHPRDEFRLRRADGTWRWVEAVAANLLGVPSVHGIVVNYHDITDRKATELQLAESEDRYRDLVENSHDLICTHDLDGNLLSVNPYAGQLLGYTTAELLQMNLRDVLTPAAQKYFARYLSKVRRDGMAAGDMHVRTRGGEVRVWEYRNTLRTQGIAAPVVRGMARDVTAQRKAEEQRRQSEHDLAEAQQVAHLGSWTLDVETNAVRWSAELYNIFGIGPGDPADLLEQLISRIHPEDRPMVTHNIAQARATGKPYQHEYRVVRPGGDVRTVLTVGKAARPRDGRVTRVYGTTQDITERKQAEDKLRQSERELAEAQRVARIGNWSRDVQTGLLRWSDEMYEIYGIEPGAPVDYDAFVSRVHPEDVGLVERSTQRALAAGDEFEHEFRIVLASGEVRTIAELGHAVVDADGKVTGLFGTAQDITQRKQAEEQLRYQAALLANIDDAIIASDPGFRITSWNDAAESLFGWKAEEVRGRDIREVLPYAPGQHGVRPADAAGDRFRAEYTLLCKDGTPVSIETSYITMRDRSGGVSARVGVSRDITERNRAQERERQQMQRLLALREIDSAITSSFDQGFTLSMLLSQVTASLGVDAADVLALNPYLGTLSFLAHRGFRVLPTRTELSASAHYSGDAVRERRVVAEPDLQKASFPFARSEIVAREQFRSYFAAPLIVKGEVKGLLEIFHRSPLTPEPEWLDFLQTLAGQAAIAIDNSQLFERLQRSNFELEIAYDSTIEGWSRALDLRDKETEGHTKRVTELSAALARQLGFTDKEILPLRRGGLLHDMGKMGVPDSILLKPGPLTDEEWVVMKKHPTFAYELLSPIRYLTAAALEIPHCHHEHWDGSGYPRGLKGEQIPISARIFAVVDVWDALTSDRPYRAAWPAGKAAEYIRSLSGIQFDARVVEAFFAMLRDGVEQQGPLSGLISGV